MSQSIGYPCTHGGKSVPRCTADATVILQVPSGKLRPRCSAHAFGGMPADPKTTERYVVRRKQCDAFHASFVASRENRSAR